MNEVVKGCKKAHPAYLTSALAYKPRSHQTHITSRYADVCSFISPGPFGHTPVCFSHIYSVFVCTFTTSCTTVRTLWRKSRGHVVTSCSFVSPSLCARRGCSVHTPVQGLVHTCRTAPRFFTCARGHDSNRAVTHIHQTVAHAGRKYQLA